jgi:uncharacterized protein YbaR (Trm112 family)
VFVELLDVLRCPRPHEDSWLVAHAIETVERDVVRGTAGCPVCRATYAIAGGTVRFGSPLAPAPVHPADAEAGLRAAAFLGLSDQGGFVVLAGAWGAAGRALHDLTGVQALLWDAPPGIDSGDGLSPVDAGPSLPIAAGSARGVALDAPHAAPDPLAAAARALRPGGRLVAPVDASLPAAFRELARDDRWWVAEKEGTSSPVVPLARRSR